MVDSRQGKDGDWDEMGLGVFDEEAEDLFVGFSEQVEPGARRAECGDSVDSEEGSESGDSSTGGLGPTEEDLARWESGVISTVGDRVWKEHPVGVLLQSRCFAVDWRSSVLLDRRAFIRGLFRVVGGDASFVLGSEIRRTRAEYSVVVRMKSRVRWRSWRKELMFGHAAHSDEEGLFVRVRVPLRATDEGINAFIGQMKRRCEVFEQTSKYNEADLIRVQDKSYARPGRKKEGR